MANSGAVLLLESDQTVIKDVTCSLRLIGVPVMTCISVAEAQATVNKYRPSLIIARFKKDLANLALGLATELKSDENGKNIPLYALCSTGDQSDLEQHSSSFSGCFALPVEFPEFPRQIQEIIGVPEGPKSDPSKPIVSLKSTEHGAPVKVTEQDAEIRDRNFALAYAIQSKVLRELESDRRLNNIPIEQVPGVVNQVTAKVCIKYATEKIL